MSSDLVVHTPAGALVVPDPAQLERDRRAFLKRVQTVKDVESAGKRVNADQFTIPVFVFGHSKMCDEGYPKMIYVLLPDFRKFEGIVRGLPELEDNGSIEVIVDARGKLQREKDNKLKPPFDFEKAQLYEHDEVDGKTDKEGQIRRVRVRFIPNTLISLRNDAKLNVFESSMFAIVNVEAAAWHDDAGHVAISPKISNLVDSVEFPEELFIDWIYSHGLWSKQYKTKVRYYSDTMALQGRLPESERGDSASFRYRNDNQFVIPLGFEDRLLEQLPNPSGCYIRDITDVTKETNLVDTRKGANRYLANYQGLQWRTGAQNLRIETHFTMDLAFFPETMERLGISSVSTWKTLWPTIRPYFKVLVIGCEDAERTFNTKVVRERLFISDDPDYINQPAGKDDQGKDQVSFALSVMQRGVVWSPTSLIKSISLQITPKTVRDYFWGGDNKPQNVPGDCKTLSGLDRHLVNLSECKDARREFDNKDFTLHLITNVSIANSDGAIPMSALGNLKLDESDRLARFLSSCVLNGGANIPRQEYLDGLEDTDPEERSKIGPNSPIMRYIFHAPQGTPIVYIYAVNNSLIQEDIRIFKQKIVRLNLLPVFLGSGVTLALPSTVPAQNGSAAASAAAPSVRVEEVRSPERAKSPERPSNNGKNLKRKKADVESEEQHDNPNASAHEEEDEEQPKPKKKKIEAKTKKVAAPVVAPASDDEEDKMDIEQESHHSEPEQEEEEEEEEEVKPKKSAKKAAAKKVAARPPPPEDDEEEQEGDGTIHF